MSQFSRTPTSASTPQGTDMSSLGPSFTHNAAPPTAATSTSCLPLPLLLPPTFAQSQPQPQPQPQPHPPAPTASNGFDPGSVGLLARRLSEPDQLHKLLHRVWIFEEDLWLGCLHTAPLPVSSQLAVVADQLCVVLPILGQYAVNAGGPVGLPDAVVIGQVYHALTRQLGLTWQQCQVPPMDETSEGRARCLLFLLKLVHLQQLLRHFASVDQLLLLHGATPRHISLVRHVRMLGRLQQIFVQTSRQPDILLLWRQGLMLRPSPPEKALFLRQCLLDVPEDEQDLFALLAALLHFSEDALLSIQAIVGHAQDFQIQLLALLLRKPADVVVDAYDLAGGRPQMNRLPHTDVPNSPIGSATSVRTNPVSVPVAPALPRGSQEVRLTIIRQPPKETIKDKILNPIPGIRVDGLSEDDDSPYVIRAYVVRFGELEEVEDGLHGCVLHQVSTSRIINFKKLKIKHTCKQLNCTRICLKFQLMRQNELGAFEGLSAEATSNPMEVYSHTSQLHSTTKEDGHLTIAGLVPDRGPITGGTTVAILASDLAPTPELVVMFGSLRLRPVHTEVGWAIFQSPPYNPALGNPVCVTLSLDAGETLCETGSNFTYVPA